MVAARAEREKGEGPAGRAWMGTAGADHGARRESGARRSPLRVRRTRIDLRGTVPQVSDGRRPRSAVFRRDPRSGLPCPVQRARLIRSGPLRGAVGAPDAVVEPNGEIEEGI